MSRLVQAAFVAALALFTNVDTFQPGGPASREPVPAPQDAQDASEDVAKQAQGILRARCFECHGENGIASKDVFVLDRDRMIADKVVVAGDRSSLLLKLVETGAMPLSGDRLKAEEIAILQKWVEAGAPPFGAPKAAPRAFLGEDAILADIQRDLAATDPSTHRFLRYFSIAHLYNAGVPDAELIGYRIGLAKLVNSLSWQRTISIPLPINESGTILRVDARDFKWNLDGLLRVQSAYTYGYRSRFSKPVTDALQSDLPYIRADWFVARVSVPPLYHDALSLPDNVPALERLLGVDTKRNLREGKGVMRSGVRASGVSRSNRVVERHETAYGAYWKSFDFKSSDGEQNIFANPLQMKEDGGEMVFNLPNGMQGYFIATADGKRLDFAPIEIVSDRNHPDDPVVRNGISCMGCHFAGMKTFKDEVRPVILASTATTFDRAVALNLYPEQDVVDRHVKADTDRFTAAVVAAGGKSTADHRTEPINALSRKFSADVPAIQAAAECGMQLQPFLDKLRGSIVLNALGFGQLLLPDGAIKRDVWEENFGTVVRELGIGEFLAPGRRVGVEHAVRPRVGGVKTSGGRILSWATVVTGKPDPRVVTDPRQQQLMQRTGLPWKVVDRASGIEMLLVPPGTYLRGGSPDDPEADVDERPAHHVTITRPFYLGRTEVTNAQFRRFAPQHDSGAFRGISFDGDPQPAVRVSWDEAKAFCDRFGFRLPTEAEWELACRAGTTSARPGDLRFMAAYQPTSQGSTRNCGETQPNPWGFCDMLGNAWEWCWDAYDAGEYQRQKNRTSDPVAFATGRIHVLRGGSWHDQAKSLRSSSRGRLSSEKKDGGVGFRVARNP
jgi:formylglycine-generating enzyme required for sulfatase activity/mono/diheme cytochrome c family protein